MSKGIIGTEPQKSSYCWPTKLNNGYKTVSFELVRRPGSLGGHCDEWDHTGGVLPLQSTVPCIRRVAFKKNWELASENWWIFLYAAVSRKPSEVPVAASGSALFIHSTCHGRPRSHATTVILCPHLKQLCRQIFTITKALLFLFIYYCRLFHVRPAQSSAALQVVNSPGINKSQPPTSMPPPPRLRYRGFSWG